MNDYVLMTGKVIPLFFINAPSPEGIRYNHGLSVLGSVSHYTDMSVETGIDGHNCPGE
jgi:hypothetical protein